MRGMGAVAVVMVLLTGCNRGSELPMSTAQFVDVMVELRRAANDESTFAARRAEILSGAGVTEAMLQEYARVGARRPAMLAEAFDSITNRLLVTTEVQ